MRPTPSQLAALRAIETPDGRPAPMPEAFGANLRNRLVAGGLAQRHGPLFTLTAEGQAALLEPVNG